mmetsp:Transcript_9644/g.15823  ORF Transcript_9644/g.15823 Transcript_9644/m.15823 type:complete len:112 (-) Transcript_9644:1538-1873(-)
MNQGEGDAWDDGAIVGAFTRALQSHDGYGDKDGEGYVRATSWQGKGEGPVQGGGKPAADKQVPQVPSGFPQTSPVSAMSGPEDQELSALLMSWYYAGYQMGRYEALKGLNN